MRVCTHTHTEPSIWAARVERIHSCLGETKSKMVAPRRRGERDVLSFCVTAAGSCHPDAIPPAFITCRTARRVTGPGPHGVSRGLINPVWQLPDALSGSSPPSLSRSHIPASPGPIAGVIYILESGELWGSASELGQTQNLVLGAVENK